MAFGGNPEYNLDRISAEVEKEKTIKRAYNKATEISNRDVINLDEFDDIYKDVEKDQEHVNKLKDQWSEKQKDMEEWMLESQKLGKVFEVLFYEQAELSNWLGENAYTYLTSDYDDIINKVDIVAEFIREDDAASFLGLAVDVTIGHNTEVENKLKKIKKEIKNGELTKIKYFESENVGIRGELSNIPRVVIGVEKDTLLEMSKLWVDNKNETLGEHSIRFQVLEEILFQLEAFQEYAKQEGQDKLADTYEKSFNFLEAIYNKQKDQFKDSDKRDSALTSITESTKEVFGLSDS
ncbi:hypothetical protein ACFLZS_01885 [Patescibacteria group bacterium]